MGNFRAAWLLLRQVPGDSIIYSTGETWGVPMSLAGSLLRRRHLYHVIYAHRVFSPKWLKFLGIAGRWLAIDGWISVTQHQAQLLRQALGPDGALVTVVSQGVDTLFFDPAKATPQVDRPYILSVGVEMRNYDLLFEAARDLDVDVVVKASSAWMASGRSELASVPSNVRVIAQRLSYVELRDLYAGAACVVVPLHDTPQAAGITTILEAMAMDKPVIATRSAGLPDVLIHGQTGMIVESSASALIHAIETMLADEGQRNTLVAGARRAVRSQVTIDRHAGTVADCLPKVGERKST